MYDVILIDNHIITLSPMFDPHAFKLYFLKCQSPWFSDGDTGLNFSRAPPKGNCTKICHNRMSYFSIDAIVVIVV